MVFEIVTPFSWKVNVISSVEVRTVKFSRLLNPDWWNQISRAPAVCKVRVPDEIWTPDPPWPSGTLHPPGYWRLWWAGVKKGSLTGIASRGYTAKWWLRTTELINCIVLSHESTSEMQPTNYPQKWALQRISNIEIWHQLGNKLECRMGFKHRKGRRWKVKEENGSCHTCDKYPGTFIIKWSFCALKKKIPGSRGKCLSIFRHLWHISA